MSSRGGFKVSIDTPNALWSFDKKHLKKIMRAAGQEVSATAKGLIRASAGGPGAAPKSETGALIRSLVVRPSRSGLSVKVIAAAMAKRGGGPYGLFLEAGVQYQTKSANRPKRVHRKRSQVLTAQPGQTLIAPRPFLSTALARKAPSLQARIASAVQDDVRFERQK